MLAPTGSGKTLAAFLWGIDRLFRERAGAPRAGTRIVYVSLQALNNDIHRNLRVPLAACTSVRARWDSTSPTSAACAPAIRPARGAPWSAATRHPHYHAESLYLMLTSPIVRAIFHTVHTSSSTNPHPGGESVVFTSPSAWSAWSAWPNNHPAHRPVRHHRPSTRSPASWWQPGK